MSHIITSVCFPLLQRISPSLIPKKGLEKTKKNEWSTSDGDPQFAVKSPLLRVASGWIEIRIVMETESTTAPKVYFDLGEGFSESRSVILYQIDENTYRAELMVPTLIKGMRFDPIEEIGTFSLSSFTIKSHSETFHTIHQFASIMKHDYRRGSDTLRILRKSYARYQKHGAPGMLERVEKEYKKLHPYRVQRATSRHIAYLNWIKENETRLEEDTLSQVSCRPLISVVMPCYNAPPHYLEKAIESIIRQSYPVWELCIADDASTDKETLEVLKHYSEHYPSVKVIFREKNGNISIATNDALSLAKGEYVAFMDHDDMLASNALMEVAKAINEKPDAKLIYSDEDKIDEEERRYDPHFKSGWNPDMLLSQNYISHLTIIEKKTLDKTGGLRAGYEGAQDYDLILRLMDHISGDEIIHIEKILYHWRAIEGSTAFDPEEKSYTTEVGLLALRDYFSGRDKAIEVEIGMLPNTYKVVYPLSDQPLVSLIIPTRDGYDILSLCIKSILEKTVYQNYEIIIMDNETTDRQTLDYFEYLSKNHKNIRVIAYAKPFNYAAINNFGVAHARGELIGLVNNDVEVISDHWLTEMVQHALRPEIGAVGVKLYYDDDTIQHAGVILGVGGVAGHSHKYFRRNAHGYFSRLKIIQNLSAVTSACLLVRKAVYEEVNGMNEEHLVVAFNDVDFCLKVHTQGYRNLWTPYVELYHHESVSRGAEDNEEKIARFGREIKYMQQSWNEILQSDPFYNSNLTKMHENFTIKRDTGNAGRK